MFVYYIVYQLGYKMLKKKIKDTIITVIFR